MVILPPLPTTVSTKFSEFSLGTISVILSIYSCPVISFSIWISKLIASTTCSSAILSFVNAPWDKRQFLIYFINALVVLAWWVNIVNKLPTIDICTSHELTGADATSPNMLTVPSVFFCKSKASCPLTVSVYLKVSIFLSGYTSLRCNSNAISCILKVYAGWIKPINAINIVVFSEPCAPVIPLTLQPLTMNLRIFITVSLPSSTTNSLILCFSIVFNFLIKYCLSFLFHPYNLWN